MGLVSKCFFFQAEDGIRDLVRSRGLGDVYKRQVQCVSQKPERAVKNNYGDLITMMEEAVKREPENELSLIHI